ncbi:MAG TPA: hypothetical protein VGP47_00625 [Parachlamydiaceae bacterium]|nr:hypothetical protein [Parachlamydiaceae bacterium]
MVKIGSRLIQQHLLSRASTDRTFIKDADLQIQVPASIDKHSIPPTRTLKAVYPHFVEAKRKAPPAARATSNKNLSHKELYSAMDEARQSYKKIREIQQQLSHAYHEINTH